MKIFYAWQSDTPNSVNRGFIRRALDIAVDRLGEELELQEADRLTIDQDTQGVKGSPPIAETIFQKIRSSDVVVTDVTITGATIGGKNSINSNVAIELGFALGCHGDEVLLKVMNTDYGSPDKLPFDLRHRRWPVQYKLQPDASKAEKENVLQNLTQEFKNILAQYLGSFRPTVHEFEPTPSTLNAASFWKDEEPLIQTAKHGFSDDVQAFGYSADQPLIYLRIWPRYHMEPVPIKMMNDSNSSAVHPFSGEPLGYSWERNRFGRNSFVIGTDGLLCSTQVLKSGEIWGHDSYRLRRRDEYEFGFIPTGAVERDMIRTLHEYIKVARERFGYREEIWMEAGIVNVDGFRLALDQQLFWEKFGGTIFDDIVVKALVDTDVLGDIDQFLLTFFETVYASAGMDRPPGINGFPPKRE